MSIPYRSANQPTTAARRLRERAAAWLRDNVRSYDPACSHCVQLLDALVLFVEQERGLPPTAKDYL